MNHNTRISRVGVLAMVIALLWTAFAPTAAGTLDPRARCCPRQRPTLKLLTTNSATPSPMAVIA